MGKPLCVSELVQSLAVANTQRVQGRRGGGKMEECLGVNGRQLSLREDCNLEEREHGSLVQCLIIYYVLWQTM